MLKKIISKRRIRKTKRNWRFNRKKRNRAESIVKNPRIYFQTACSNSATDRGAWELTNWQEKRIGKWKEQDSDQKGWHGTCHQWNLGRPSEGWWGQSLIRL